mgnify:CR=1 FL=1|tara:strand:- start:5572 stop:5922 length:351 start_codon:yes stop_codon:yes gene_type:complete
MADPTKDPALISGFIQFIQTLFNSMPEQLSALFLSGAAGAYVRAVFAPQTAWRRRLAEGVAGAFGAIFLGGLLGHTIDATVGGDSWAFLASGFVMGEGGIAAIRGVRRMILKEDAK